MGFKREGLKKERRKEYRGVQEIDKGSRPGGGCKWARSGRLHKHVRSMPLE